MPDYKDSKIYSIVAPDGTKYIGSTTQTLQKRLIAHKTKYRSWKKGEYHFFTCFKLFDDYGMDNCKIELIEQYKCDTKNELEKREGYYIETLDCINKVIAGRHESVWRIENHDMLLEYWRQYYADNKEKYKEKNKLYYESHKDIINARRRKKKTLIQTETKSE